MPIPGPRTQDGPVPGFRNPERRLPDLFNQWDRPGPIAYPGRTPGLMVITLRGCILGAGQIRRFWRQSVNLSPAQAAYSWSQNAPQPGRPIVSPGGFEITRALRYMTRSVYMGAGEDNTRYAGLHTVVPKKNRYKPVTINSGQRRGTPTVRNRLTSFGSRVTPINPALPAAEDQSS